MRGSVDPAPISIVGRGPPAARGSIWTTPNHHLPPRRLLGPKVCRAVKMNMQTSVIISLTGLWLVRSLITLSLGEPLVPLVTLGSSCTLTTKLNFLRFRESGMQSAMAGGD